MQLFQNGFVVDGTGAAGRVADVLIDGATIAAVAPHLHAPDAQRIDCSGLAVAPGFIDAHSHSDVKVLENRPDKARQGVTTEIVGNCGFSAFPSGPHPEAVRDYANGILCGGEAWQWPQAAAYAADARRLSANANVYALTGHGTLRVAQAGMRQGALDAADLAALEASLDTALAGGAIGFSTGLMYAPGSSAPFDELQRCCSIVARHDGSYCTHMRSYSWDLLDSLEEQFRIAEAARCRLQISHLQVVGRANWDKQEQALERIEAARRSGLDVEFDCYPYLAGSTVLQQLLPQHALEGGAAGFLGRIANAAVRRDVARETEAMLAQTWADIMISGVASPANQPLVGMTVAEIAFQRECAPVDAVIDLLIEEETDVKMISFNQSEENLRVTLTHPLSVVISDGFYVQGRPHPRLFGTFPELLGKYVREKRWMTLESAVHKITGKPAMRFRLAGRGLLKPGAFADVTIFDPVTIGSPASYSDPQQPPTGVHLVLREGKEIYRKP